MYLNSKFFRTVKKDKEVRN